MRKSPRVSVSTTDASPSYQTSDGGPPEAISTQSFREWSDAIWNVYGALEVAAHSDERFAGAFIRRSLDNLRTVEMHASPMAVRRTASMVKTHPVDEVIVTMIVEGQAMVVQDGRSCALGPGDFAFLESRRPYSMVLHTSSRLIDFAWPRQTIGLSEDEGQAVTALAISAQSSMGRWLSPALLGLHEMDQEVSRSGAFRIADGISNLLVTAALELVSSDALTDRWRAPFDEMVKYIEGHLDDPDLTVESIAARFYMSPRSVHRLFAKFGTTVASSIRDIRLEEARRRMLSRSYQTKSISVIASQLGFSSLQVFSRAFAAKYGVAPKQYRAAHQ